MAPRDIFQKIFLLSLASNAVNDSKKTQTSLQKSLEKKLTVALGILNGRHILGPQKWKIVWGPVVWKNEPDDATTGPDNSWYVAHHPALEFEDNSVHPTYVIAIAATPPRSNYAWVDEDFAVDSVVDFNAWVAGGIRNQPVVVPAVDVVPGTPYIAKGTVKTVHLLLNTPAPQSAKNAGKTLLEFLTSVEDLGNSRVISTGHSLGGALSPSLALTLVSSGVIPADRTLTYPSAGPSPGNEAFTELFTAALPSRKSNDALSYQGWNLNLVNTLDIVPQAWSDNEEIYPKQNLGNIHTIYGGSTFPIIKGISIALASHALRSGVQYSPLPSQYFTTSTSFSPPEKSKEFFKLVRPNHVEAYIQEVGVKDLIQTSKTSEVFDLGVPEIEWADEDGEQI